MVAQKRHFAVFTDKTDLFINKRQVIKFLYVKTFSKRFVGKNFLA